MKLNKLERYTAYCILLQELEERQEDWRGRLGEYYINGQIFGLCELLAHILEEDDDLLDILDKYGLSEIKKQKPKPCGIYWFKNKSERIAALEQCIKKTHP